MEIARVHDLHPTTVAQWKQEFLENGAAMFGKDSAPPVCEKKIKEMERPLGHKEVELALLQTHLLQFEN